MTSQARQAIMEAVRILAGRDDPEPLLPLARRIANVTSDALYDELLETLLTHASPGDALVTGLGQILAGWDAQSMDMMWARETPAFSADRRAAVCQKLQLTPVAANRMLELRPVLDKSATPITISEEFKRWYSPSRIVEHEFYWPRYSSYLREVRGWNKDTVERLDLATTQVMERLADPISEKPASQRGLVVGFVQSGKTANYSGVIAKAIDAGYRYIVVLTGMHEALRRQTQRRLDMELLGKRNILLDSSEFAALGTAQGEYLEDPAWINGEFSNLGGATPSPEIMRLTSYSEDFNEHKFSGLRFKASGEHVELFRPELLYRCNARIAVVKKNKDVLKHLLAAMRANQSSMLEVPTLIIDDESDQASVNTAKPSWRTGQDTRAAAEAAVDRKSINNAISAMLKIMPRAQYVGYTATPFANVFIDPSDNDDIFPQHFIIALDEPTGYMGASSFFDSVAPEGATTTLSNKQAYVRELMASDADLVGQENELRGALAAYVVTGAIKLLRESEVPSLSRNFRHHTMLVHEATQKTAHTSVAKRIVALWRECDWLSARGLLLLEEAFEDLRPTLEDRGDPSVPFTDDFERVKRFIPMVIERVETLTSTGIRSQSNCALVVNSDTEVEKKLDFDRHSTWKIVVGGAMLSRGFTIEGLTISYFRRSPRAQDTLLQMGRWFGYRPGYRDLVRIYLAANTSISKSQMVNLYDAFDAMAETESEFRRQLAIYSQWDGESPAITPRGVRPLVQQSLPWLKPTAPNKMYNTKIKRQCDPTFSPKAMDWSPAAVDQNWSTALPLIAAANKHLTIEAAKPGGRQVPAWAGVVAVADVAKVLRSTLFLDEYQDLVVRPKVAYYEYCESEGRLADFLVLFPQLIEGRGRPRTLRIGQIGERTLAVRTRNARDYYGEFTDPAHRGAAEAFITGASSCPESLKEFDIGGTRGLVLGYLIPEMGPRSTSDGTKDSSLINAPEGFTVGLTVFLPSAAVGDGSGKKIEYEAIDHALDF